MSELSPIKPLVILDRDGVINEDSDDYIKTVDEWQPISGSIEAIAELSKAGYKVVVASNQSGLSRGFFDEYTLGQMHEKLHTLVEQAGGSIDGIFLCTHLPEEDCFCRKPRTGLLEQIENEFDTSVAGAWFIGDSEKDLDCALAMGCHPILVLTGKGLITQAAINEEKASHCQTYDNLASATKHILASQEKVTH